jgi:hypothetical protein
MKGYYAADFNILFAPLSSETSVLLLEGMSYEMSWQFSQVFLFGYVSTSLTDLLTREEMHLSSTPPPPIEDEFLVDLPAEIREDMVAFAWRAKQFENAPISRSTSRAGGNRTFGPGSNPELESFRHFRGWSEILEAYFSSKDTRESSPFRVWDYYGNPVLPRLVGKATRRVIS